MPRRPLLMGCACVVQACCASCNCVPACSNGIVLHKTHPSHAVPCKAAVLIRGAAHVAPMPFRWTNGSPGCSNASAGLQLCPHLLLDCCSLWLAWETRWHPPTSKRACALGELPNSDLQPVPSKNSPLISLGAPRAVCLQSAHQACLQANTAASQAMHRSSRSDPCCSVLHGDLDQHPTICCRLDASLLRLQGGPAEVPDPDSPACQNRPQRDHDDGGGEARRDLQRPGGLQGAD